MLELRFENQEFLQELENSDIRRAFELDLTSIKLYEYYANCFSDGILKDILNAKKQLNQLLISDNNALLVECSLNDAYLLLLAKEFEIVQAYKIAANVCKDEKLKDLIFRLWASSVNEYQVALRKSLATNEFNVDSLVSNFLKDILK
ncbi:hypothetical protein AVBRAN9333_05280 [Campylobacter sp. RM9333]|uniref:hypothetical protein n=1 Tax=Campylobacter sp. RM9333 TaxID=2735731 RepID=UPI001D967005|nr:hypothetical protein [Campylobacter sp. RM9333]